MLTETPYKAALRYWAGLGAPVAAVAAALRRDEAEVAADLAAMTPDATMRPLAGYPSQVAWPDRTVAAIVRRGLARATDGRGADQFVLLAGEGALSAAELRDAIALAASGLQSAGIRKGSRVAVDATQRIESLIIAAATLLIGAVVVRLSLSGGVHGMRQMLAAARAEITFTEVADQLVDAGAGSGRLVALTPGNASNLTDFERWLDDAPPATLLPAAEVDPRDLALIGFTSGSTGAPALVETSHLAAFRASEAMVAMFGFDSSDIFCTSTDFSALSALRSMLTVPFLCGGRILLPSAQARVQPLALAEECTAHGVTRLTAIPNVLRGLTLGASRLPAGSLDRLRMVFSGSGVLDQATRDAFHAVFPVPVIDYYGGREFATALYARPETGATVSSGGGMPCNCLISIVDDNGRQVPDGQAGEIMVHSDCLMASELAGSHPDWRGWHQSGDRGRIAGPNLVQVVGRRRDVIKAADGSLVFPVEIEALLNEVPSVRESCVMGWVRSDGSERIVAAVLLADEATDAEPALRAHVLTRAGRFRVPHRIIAVEAFPRTGTNKIDKSALRDQLTLLLSDL